MHYLPFIFCGLSIPISLLLWSSYVTFLRFTSNTHEEPTVISPTRWLFVTLAPLLLMLLALRRKSVNKSGAAFGIVVAIILSIANVSFFGSLVTFFFSSSRATKFRAHIKKKFELNFKEGEGQRNWVQVLCNGGMATLLAILYLIDCGSSERSINFEKDYRASWLSVAVMSAFACCNGDTWASELGSVLSKRDPFLISTLKRVPRGTNGGVSLIGLLVSFAGGLAIGLSYYLCNCYVVDAKLLALSPPQWPLIVFGGIAGLYGSLVDSLLGATLQYSGLNEQGKIVEHPGTGIKHISGRCVLDNHSVNFISSIISSITIPLISFKFWPSV